VRHFSVVSTAWIRPPMSGAERAGMCRHVRTVTERPDLRSPSPPPQDGGSLSQVTRRR
jgi:hypothetical protein